MKKNIKSRLDDVQVTLELLGDVVQTTLENNVLKIYFFVKERTLVEVGDGMVVVKCFILHIS